MRMDGRCCTLTAGRKRVFYSSWGSFLMPQRRLGYDLMKAVVYPIRQVAPRQTLRGLRDDFGHLTADVVLLAGEVHNGYKAVSLDTASLDRSRLHSSQASLRFTTVAGRDVFSRLVLYHLRATHKVYELAATLAARMKERTGGRMWLAAHMRRGDCT